MAKWVEGQLKGKAITRSAVKSAVKSAVRLIVGLVVGVVAGAAAGVATKSAAAIGEEIIKWDKEALDALFNKTIKYSVINNYIFTISKLYIQQLKNKALLLLQWVKPYCCYRG